jgi:hypothetical protein
LKETEPTRSTTERRTSWFSWFSWAAPRSRREILLFVVCGIVVVAGIAWAILTYLNGSAGKAELLTYRLCVGHEKAQCPIDAAFVRDEGEDTVARWTQRQCASYKARRIVISDGPTKECGCYLADVRCSTEY